MWLYFGSYQFFCKIGIDTNFLCNNYHLYGVLRTIECFPYWSCLAQRAHCSDNCESTTWCVVRGVFSHRLVIRRRALEKMHTGRRLVTHCVEGEHVAAAAWGRLTQVRVEPLQDFYNETRDCHWKTPGSPLRTANFRFGYES